MRRLLYIALIINVLSCAKQSKEAPIEVDAVEIQENMVLESPMAKKADEGFAFQQLTQQKLQEYYDLIVLQKQHPEFKEDINSQLKELSRAKILVDASEEVQIKNVQQIGKSEQASDTIQKIRIRFDVVGTNSTRTDTLTAIIKTKKMMLDNKEVVSTKVVFLQIK